MEVEYFIEEEIKDHARKGVYVPLKMKVHRDGTHGFKKGYPWQRFSSNVSLERRKENDEPTYIVVYIQHDGDDEDVQVFYSRRQVDQYLKALTNAIYQREGVSEVDVHYDSGKKNLFELVQNIPDNSYTSFRTPKNTFSVTVGRV